ncbi:hypothetical protein [Sphaerisporangium aureirubrum]|uniref:CBM2 domain-containing protein n=1 Tax=Sphaerisporangium aureirubrum TaxID=1544736 RepID=A0ABW1NTV5_9ACTN
MKRLPRVFARVLCVIALVAAGLATTVTSAGAATPNVWGFAVVNVTSGVPLPSHQAGSWPTGFNVTVSSSAVGQFLVTFPQIGTTARGIVHVTAISQSPVWCQVQAWGTNGTDELALVQCYQYGGAPVYTAFSIMFEESTGTVPPAQGALAYVHWNGGMIGSTYNSLGATNTVIPVGVGIWNVTLNGLGTGTQAGGVQVTAVNTASAARCKVGAWVSTGAVQQIQVRCHNATSAPLNTAWNLSFQFRRAITGGAAPPANFGYTYDNSPGTAGPYAPVPPNVNFNSLGSVNTIQTAAPGQRLVVFPAIGVLPDHVQVTASGPGPEYCNLLTLWITSGGVVRVHNVVCYNATTPVIQPSLVTYTSAV